MEDKRIRQLIREAKEQMTHAYAPYSHFKVGAALLTKAGKIYTGCNIENAAYTPTNCAERTAFFKAVSEGERAFQAIAIVGGSSRPVDTFTDMAYPCGICRQVMREFCQPQFRILVGRNTEDYEEYTLKELLPKSFSMER